MAKLGIPKNFSKCKFPTCAACIFGRNTRRKWKESRIKTSGDSNEKNEPGEMIAVYQLVSQVPRFIDPKKGKLTHDRYTCATIFFEVASGYLFVCPQKTTSS